LSSSLWRCEEIIPARRALVSGTRSRLIARFWLELVTCGDRAPAIKDSLKSSPLLATLALVRMGAVRIFSSEAPALLAFILQFATV
jgi:hypothetical protein